MFFLMKAHILAERSTKVPSKAPREIASMPTAPEPAHKSRNLPPRTRRAIILNIASRIFLVVGRTLGDVVLLKNLPRCFPSVTCISEVIFICELSIFFQDSAGFAPLGGKRFLAGSNLPVGLF